MKFVFTDIFTEKLVDFSLTDYYLTKLVESRKKRHYCLSVLIEVCGSHLALGTATLDVLLQLIASVIKVVTGIFVTPINFCLNLYNGKHFAMNLNLTMSFHHLTNAVKHLLAAIPIYLITIVSNPKTARNIFFDGNVQREKFLKTTVGDDSLEDADTLHGCTYREKLHEKITAPYFSSTIEYSDSPLQGREIETFKQKLIDEQQKNYELIDSQAKQIDKLKNQILELQRGKSRQLPPLPSSAGSRSESIVSQRLIPSPPPPPPTAAPVLAICNFKASQGSYLSDIQARKRKTKTLAITIDLSTLKEQLKKKMLKDCENEIPQARSNYKKFIVALSDQLDAYDDLLSPFTFEPLDANDLGEFKTIFEEIKVFISSYPDELEFLNSMIEEILATFQKQQQLGIIRQQQRTADFDKQRITIEKEEFAKEKLEWLSALPTNKFKSLSNVQLNLLSINLGKTVREIPQVIEKYLEFCSIVERASKHSDLNALRVEYQEWKSNFIAKLPNGWSRVANKA